MHWQTLHIENNHVNKRSGRNSSAAAAEEACVSLTLAMFGGQHDVFDDRGTENNGISLWV